RGGLSNPGEVEVFGDAAGIASQEALEIGITGSKAGPDEDRRARLDSPVALLVGLDVIGGKTVVAIDRALFSNIDHPGGAHEPGKGDIRGRGHSHGKVDGRIEVR